MRSAMYELLLCVFFIVAVFLSLFVVSKCRDYRDNLEHVSPSLGG